MDLARPGTRADALKSALRSSLDEFYAVASIRTVSGTTDTILVSDKGNAVRYTSDSAIAVTVPAGLGAGFTCLLLQRGAGVFTVTGSDATVDNLNSEFASAGVNAQCSLFADSADELLFGGDTA